MKKTFLFLVIAALGLQLSTVTAQNTIDKQGRRQGHWLKTDKQGAKVYQGTFKDGLETGTFTYYYADGKVRIRNTYSVPGKVCQHEVFDPEGHLLATGEYNQKNRHGRWEFFNEKGKLIKITYYNMGVRHGMQAVFTAEGDTAEVCNWVDNHRHGRWWKRIGKQGYITVNYNHGAIEGDLREYDDNGQLIRQGHYTDNERNGHFKTFEGGRVVVDETWVMGLMKDKQVRLLLPEETMVSIYDINYMFPQGKKQVAVYLTNGNKLTDLEEAENLYRHVGDGRFSLVNKEQRIMVATDLIVGTTKDSEGREILDLDPKPDFDVFPDEDCMHLLKSLKMQQQTTDAGGTFDFEN